MKRVFDFVKHWASEAPDREAIVYKDRRIDYKGYNLESDRVARALIAAGVNKGDKVGLWIPNHPEYLFSYVGCSKAGAVSVPLSVRFSVTEVSYVLRHSDASVLILEPAFGMSDFISIFNEARAGLPGIQKVVVIGDENDASRIEGAVTFEEFLKAGDGLEAELEAREAEVDEDDTFVMFFTSGTTGQPKAPELSHSNVVNFVYGELDAADFQEGSERLLMDIPSNHVGGGVMAILSMLVSGGTLVLLDMFVPGEVLKTIQDEKITILGQVPAQYILMFMQPDFGDYDLSSVSKPVASGAPVPPELVVAMKEKLGTVPFVGYGLTETCGAVTMTRADFSIEKIASTIGTPTLGIEVVIKDDDGKEVARGEAGEICIRGKAVMKGYYKQPEATADVFDSEGFFHTGDIGLIDEDGHIRIKGRKKEMYIRGGENVYPPEVEEVVGKHPKVLFTAVIGIPDQVMGEKGRAYVVLQPGAELTGDELRDYCRAKLAHFKVPDEIVFRSELPLTPLGKVHKFLLYEEAKAERG